MSSSLLGCWAGCSEDPDVEVTRGEPKARCWGKGRRTWRAS